MTDNLDLDEYSKKILAAKTHVRAVLTPETIISLIKETISDSKVFNFLSTRAERFISVNKPEFKLTLNIDNLHTTNYEREVRTLLQQEIFDIFSEKFRLLIKSRDVLNSKEFNEQFRFEVEEIKDIEDDIITQLFMSLIVQDVERGEYILNDKNELTVYVYYLW
jgi:hypothetical protein